MDQRKNWRVTALFVAAIVVLGMAASAGPARATLDPYRLNGGVFGRHYWLDPNMINTAYMPLMRNAVSSWNSTPTRVYFTETTSQCCDSQADFFAKDYGATSCRGVTMSYLNGGAGV